MNHFLANNMCKDYTDVQGEMNTLIQLNLPTNANYQEPVYFAPNTMLDGENAIITGIELIVPATLSNAPDGKTNIDALYQNKAILTISDLNRQIIAELPLSTLNRRNNGGKLKFTYFKTHVWQNCYVEFLDTPFSSPLIPLLFNVYYTLKEKA